MTLGVSARYDSLLFDLDGTVWEGGRLLPDAAEVINSSDLSVMYITNNASRGPDVVAGMLTQLGIPTSTSQVLTSAQAAVEFAQQHLRPGTAVYVLGSESFKELARQGGFKVVESADESPQAVLHGHNPQTGWAQLSEAALSIQRGALYFASNLDTTLPMERGLMVGNGSLVAAVAAATGVQPTSAGKPEPAMFFSAAKKLQSAKPLAIGDRLNTDIAGGVAAKMDTFHVCTGVSQHWSVVHAEQHERPTYLGRGLSDLGLDLQTLVPQLQNGYTVSAAGSDIVLSGGDGDSMAALRSVLTLAWATAEPFSGTVRAVGAAAEQALAEWH